MLIYGLIAVGIYFTIRLRFQQVLHFGEMIRSITRRALQRPARDLAVSGALLHQSRLARRHRQYRGGRGGAGSWRAGGDLLDVGRGFCRDGNRLCRIHAGPALQDKGRSDASAVYRGGPAFYIAKGLGMPWLGAVFSVCLILSFGLVFNAVQANSIADAMQGAFGLPKIVTGLGLAVLTAVVIFGGIRQIAQVAEYVVPFMAGIYLLVAIIVVIMNITEVPAMLWHIIGNAFGLVEAAGGVAGGVAAAMLNGVKRGLLRTRRAWARRRISLPPRHRTRTTHPARGSFRPSACSSTRSSSARLPR